MTYIMNNDHYNGIRKELTGKEILEHKTPEKAICAYITWTYGLCGTVNHIIIK